MSVMQLSTSGGWYIVHRMCSMLCTFLQTCGRLLSIFCSPFCHTSVPLPKLYSPLVTFILLVACPLGVVSPSPSIAWSWIPLVRVVLVTMVYWDLETGEVTFAIRQRFAVASNPHSLVRCCSSVRLQPVLIIVVSVSYASFSDVTDDL